MKNKVFLILFSLWMSSTFAYCEDTNLLSANTSAQQVGENLVLNQQWISFPVYKDRAAWNKLVGANKATLIKRGEAQLGYKWQLIKATDYLEYERSGNRDVMQKPNSANLNALSALVLAELAEGEGRFIDQIINGVFQQCERTSWVLSAHLPAQHSKRTLPDHNEQVIDLGSGDISGFMSWTYYFLREEFDKVNPVISERLYSELYNRIILPYRNETRFWWMAFEISKETTVNNWNPWCNFNALQCMMLLENDKEKLQEDVYKSMRSVDKFINYVNADGACEEGPSYWGHAAGKLYDYLKMLSLATNGKMSYFDNPTIKKMGEYMPNTYVGNDWVVNFADASAQFSSDAGLIYRYGDAVDSNSMKEFAAYLVGKGKNTITYGMDFFRTLESLSYNDEIRKAKAGLPTTNFVVYPETQFYYLKNKNDFFLATKGGYNAESHNHNDAGTFSLYYKHLPMLIDVGVGTYTRQTFGPERYSIWTMQSQYHNLPSINGEQQKFGHNYKASDIQIDEKDRKVSINIANAYDKQAGVEKWNRIYKLEDNKLVIQDEFNLNTLSKPNQVHFMLWDKIDISKKGKVKINVQGVEMLLTYDSATFDASLEPIELSDVRLSKVWGDKVYRLTLTSKNTIKVGTYEYTISPSKN